MRAAILALAWESRWVRYHNENASVSRISITTSSVAHKLQQPQRKLHFQDSGGLNERPARPVD
jgi:hypothetical protein